MSVRRLADLSVQPPVFAFSNENADWARTVIRRYPEGRQQSAVIPLLMRAQEQEGWVTKAAIEHVSKMLEMPLIRVLEVATFYTQFQLKPVGTKAHVQVCGTTPCMLRGAEALMDVCRSKIHHEQFHTNADGALSWEVVDCLGACVNAPMVMVFKDTYEDLTPDRLAEIIDQFEAGDGASVPVGPQTDRMRSAPVGGPKALSSEDGVLRAANDWRRREEDAAAPAEGNVAPSYASKPVTDAPETNPAVKSPSPVKADQKAEQNASNSPAPARDGNEANKAEPVVEGEAKQRRGKGKSAGEQPEKRAPELAAGKTDPANGTATAGVDKAGGAEKDGDA